MVIQTLPVTTEIVEASQPLPGAAPPPQVFLIPDAIYQGDARTLLKQVEPNSIALSVWTPPYFVGKSYERDLSFTDW